MQPLRQEPLFCPNPIPRDNYIWTTTGFPYPTFSPLVLPPSFLPSPCSSSHPFVFQLNILLTNFISKNQNSEIGSFLLIRDSPFSNFFKTPVCLIKRTFSKTLLKSVNRDQLELHSRRLLPWSHLRSNEHSTPHSLPEFGFQPRLNPRLPSGYHLPGL